MSLPALEFSIGSQGLEITERDELQAELSFTQFKSNSRLTMTPNTSVIRRNYRISLPQGFTQGTEIVDGKTVHVFGVGPYALVIKGNIACTNSDGSFVASCISSIETFPVVGSQVASSDRFVNINPIPAQFNRFGATIATVNETGTLVPIQIRALTRNASINQIGTRFNFLVTPNTTVTLTVVPTGGLQGTLLSSGTNHSITFPAISSQVVVNATTATTVGNNFTFIEAANFEFRNLIN